MISRATIGVILVMVVTAAIVYGLGRSGQDAAYRAWLAGCERGNNVRYTQRVVIETLLKMNPPVERIGPLQQRLKAAQLVVDCERETPRP